jgi:ammonium transporter, Amt family
MTHRMLTALRVLAASTALFMTSGTVGAQDAKVTQVPVPVEAAAKGGASTTPASAATAPASAGTPMPAAAPVAAAATAPAAAPAAPAEVKPPEPNKGDNAWMIMATVLVIFMTLPGLALFYGGLVRSKNMLSVLMQVFCVSALIYVLWIVYGYSVAFTEGNPFFGTFSKMFLSGVTPSSTAATFSKGVVISEYIYVAFQATFAAITCALIVGAFAERMKFSAVLLFVVIWFTFSYLPIAHMVWYWSGPDAYKTAADVGVENAKAGFLFAKGALDFAGGTVVHISAGIAGLVAAIMVGKRVGYGKEAMTPHSLTLTMVGASMLWVGWFGFNAGSNLEATGTAGLAFINTLVAASIAVLTWMGLEWMLKGKPSMLGAATGAVAGLVAITPAAGFVGPVGALAIGLIASAACLWGVTGLKRMLGADDALDVFGVHCVGGIVGAFLTGIFASPDLGGIGVLSWVDGKQEYAMAGQVISQIWGIVVSLLWSGFVAVVALFIVKALVDLRVPEDEEREGLDTTSHGETAYSH